MNCETFQDIVALSGAHALGRCHTTSSGFSGPWTRAPTTFSNEYYRELLENTWTVKKWSGPKQVIHSLGYIYLISALTRSSAPEKFGI